MSGDVRTVDQLALGSDYTIEELLDRGALSEMLNSFEDLFGVSLRVYSSSGQLLADTQLTPRLYRLLERKLSAKIAVQKVVDAVRRSSPGPDAVERIPCISGGRYLASAIVYDRRVIGRAILGPFVAPNLVAPPESLIELAEDIDSDEVLAAWSELPRLGEEEVVRIDGHLRSTLDLLVFSGLKALMAQSMHLAAVTESFRQLQQQNDKLQVAYDRLKELDRLKSNFLATVSHELRTPLTSIIGYSEMLLQGIAGDLAAEQGEFVTTIHQKGEQLLALIKSLLDLSKLESGTMSLHKADLDAQKLVDDVVGTLTPTALRKGVELAASVQAAVPPLFGDVERLRQVLLNLTENAIKFTPKDGRVTVSVENTTLTDGAADGVGAVLFASVTRPAVAFTVADTGVGIPEDERERVFDAFYQVDSSSTREAGGTGLGLSIVKRLVDAHDGRVTVTQNEPRGAKFVVTIPHRKRSAG